MIARDDEEEDSRMALEHGPEDLAEARKKAAGTLKILDPTWMASRAEVRYSFPERSFFVPFFGEVYRVFYPSGEVTRPDGSPAGAREAIILLHYLTHADGTRVQGRWVAYRDLPGARYHEPAFVADVEQPLSRGLSGRLDDLREWASDKEIREDLPGDLAIVWKVLPRVPLLVIFNERDEEFPASARVLFDASAPNYLPTEDLSVLAEIAVARILEELGALPR
ncbi:MAG: DUF3786 domain-containing protein [Candidatus Geothermincolales bacterium]